MTKTALQDELEKMGWCGLDERVWARLDDFRDGRVILAPPLDTIPSPAGNAIYTLVEELAARAEQPTLVLARWPAQGTPQECPISDRILYDTAPFSPGWLEQKLPYRLKRSLTGSGAPYLYAYARRAARLCRLLDIKKIIVEDVPVFALPLRAGNKQAKIYLHQHIDAPKSVPGYYWKKVLASLDGILFVARTTREFTESLHGPLPVPATVVYNGVDLAHYDPLRWRVRAGKLRTSLGIHPNVGVLLFVGRIIPIKGVAEAAEAFNAVQPNNFHFVVVGDLNRSLYADLAYTDRLKQAAADSNGTIHLLGARPQQELPALYAMSDLVIVPSIGHEGLPKVITEALAMGKPIAASNRGGILEILKPGVNGWLLEHPEDVNQLSVELATILQDRHEIAHFGESAFLNDRPWLGLEQCANEFYCFIA